MKTSPRPSLASETLLGRKGFTLVELLVVIGIIAGLTALFLGNMQSGGSTVALKSAQAAVAGAFTVARAKVMSSAQACRMLFNIDPTSTASPSRFLRYIVLQTQTPAGWQTVTDLYLPKEVYVVPGDFTSLPAGLFSEGASFWVKSASSAVLRSTMLRASQITTEAINTTTPELWASCSISGIGNTAHAGDLVLGAGRQRAPGSYSAGDSPIELYHRDGVCGIAFSSYGLAVLIEDRSGF